MKMSKEEIEQLLNEIHSFKAEDRATLEEFRIRFLGKKGIVRELFTDLKNTASQQRKELGKVVNELKNKVEEKISSIKKVLENAEPESISNIDLTLPAEPIGLGTRHPISIVKREMIEIFERIGFTISEGPEIENDWYNFTALNIPEDHPARDMQDTFFIEKDPDILLRTHTSPQQIRVMENSQPPIRIICPGRVYRNETILQFSSTRGSTMPQPSISTQPVCLQTGQPPLLQRIQEISISAEGSVKGK